MIWSMFPSARAATGLVGTMSSRVSNRPGDSAGAEGVPSA